MLKGWETAVVTPLAAMYVPSGHGKAVHKNRVGHGFVLNDPQSDKNYIFSDGTVLHTPGSSLFYLPKGSDYYVDTFTRGGCYAINFDAEIEGAPFALTPRNTEPFLRLFKEAADTWKRQDSARQLIAARNLYDLFLLFHKEWQREYLPKRKESLLSPALAAMHERFTDNDLTVSSLARLCGVSEVYFRKLFLESRGVSPKDYIISLRMEYAKQLLTEAQVSVSEAALMCGYAEPCHFSREFARRVGKSPSAYRKTKNET